MALKSANTLKGKVLLATSVLAFFICTFGLISYLVVSLLINDAFYGVFIPFLFLGFVVMVFGGWLSNEIVNPIEKITLLAKSLERGASNSIPKTTGSYETDQLLQTLHRNSQQTQKLVTLMDKVTSGEIDIALSPLQDADRLTVSFQKLLAKFSESIHAKNDLTKLQDELNQIKREISTVRNGNLDVEIKSDFFQTKEITETFKYLIEHLSLVIAQLKQDSQNTQASAAKIEKTIDSVILQDENRVLEMNQASVVLKQVPNLVRKISGDLSTSANSAKQSIEKARLGNKIAHENSNAVSKVRKQMRDAAGGIQSLNERAQEISRVAKTVEDLSHRTNMIALNASIQASEIGEKGHRFVLIAEEFEKLADRADGTNRQISSLNKSIMAEISKVENSLETTSAEVANLSRFAIETANVLSELERYVGQFLNLQENLIAYSQQHSEETDQAFRTFTKSIGETEGTVTNLKDSALQIKNLSNVMRNLQMLISEYRIVQEKPRAETEKDEKKSPDHHAAGREGELRSEEEENYEFYENDQTAVFSPYRQTAGNVTSPVARKPGAQLAPPIIEAEEMKTGEKEKHDEEISARAEAVLKEAPPAEENSEENSHSVTEDLEDKFDDLQIEERKISYETSELSLEINADSPVPTYEEI